MTKKMKGSDKTSKNKKQKINNTNKKSDSDKQIALSDEQKAYIEYTKSTRDTKLIAAPGSGKSRCIMERLKFLIDNKYFKKSEVYVITFSRFANDGFRERVRVNDYTDYIDEKNISTIDSLARSIITNKKLYTNNNVIVNLDDLVDVYSLKFLYWLKDQTKTNVRKSNIIKNMKCLFVDEAQDLNEIQYNILTELKKKNETIVHLIGDPNQNIYQFRKSSAKYLMEYKAKEFCLTVNYRSSGNIINFSKNLRPHKEKNVTGVSKKGKPVILVNKTQYNIQKYILEKIKDHNSNENIDYSDMAIICPTKHSIKNNYGLATIANYLIDNKVNVNQCYDDSKLEGEPVNYKPKKGSINLLTYHATKGLEWSIVFVLEASSALSNRKPDHEKLKHEQYLLHVATSRAISQMYICTYNYNYPKINYWLGNIDKSCYKIEGTKPDFITFSSAYGNVMQDNKIFIGEIVAGLNPQQWLNIMKLFNNKNISIKTEKIFDSYVDQNKEKDEVILSEFINIFFSYCLYLNKKIKIDDLNERFKNIQKLIDNKLLQLSNSDYKVLYKYFHYKWKEYNCEFTDWDYIDTDKKNYKNVDDNVIKIIKDNSCTKIDFDNFKSNMDIKPLSHKFIKDNLEDIKKSFKKYKKCKKWKLALESLFHLCVINNALKNGHTYYIKNKGKIKNHLLKTFEDLFEDIYKYSRNKTVKNITERVSIMNSEYYIKGEINMLINKKITEIKCTKNITIKNIIHLILNNYCHQESELKKRKNNFTILNFLTGKKYNIELDSDKSTMKKFMAIITNKKSETVTSTKKK